jgi:putative ABC transport system permease protein
MKFHRLIFANLFRKKIRLVLTIGSFAIALVLFMFLAVVKSAFSRGTEIAGADRLVITNRIGLIQTIPIDTDKILTIPGVKAVTHNNWFGGVYVDENFFPHIDVENRCGDERARRAEDQWQSSLDRHNSSKCFGWKVGDRIPIMMRFTAPQVPDFNLDGIYHSDKPAMKANSGFIKLFDERVRPSQEPDRLVRPETQQP